MAKNEKNESAEIKDLRAKYAALNAKKSELAAKRDKVIAKHEINEKSITALIAKTKEAEKAVKLAERQRLRDEITTAQLDEVVSDHLAAEKVMQEADRMRHLAFDVIRELEREIRDAESRERVALGRICNLIRSDLEKEAGFEKVRAKLLEIYTCSRLSGGGLEWFQIVMPYFPEPETAEAIEVKKEFVKKNNLG